jgi:hypothetical protein
MDNRRHRFLVPAVVVVVIIRLANLVRHRSLAPKLSWLILLTHD